MASLELPKELPFDFLKTITNDFSSDRIIASDPFGTLYKGILPDDDKVIAVKKLQENAPFPAYKTFSNEVQHIMVLKHKNLVEMVGFCSETTRKLVKFNQKYIQADITESLLCYEYFPLGTLDDYLFETNEAGISSAKHDIDWDTRFEIVRGICNGLHFLHRLDIPVIHMDLKLGSVWLDPNMVPKIGNFGLSRIFGQEQTRMCTQTVVGSYGYMAPEYIYRGEISAQTDIYSLGLMIIEIVTGEKYCPENNQPSARRYITRISKDWTPHHIASKYGSLDSGSLMQVNACIEIGLQCLEIDRKLRPSIDRIIDRLNGVR